MELVVDNEGGVKEPSRVEKVKNYFAPKEVVSVHITGQMVTDILAAHFWKDSVWLKRNYSRSCLALHLGEMMPNGLTLEFEKD